MRTSWNVGLWTCASEPVPRAMPRTNVVLPEPSGPASSARSPAFRRDPVCSPSASVSAAEAVVTSRKVVVATCCYLGALEIHLALPREHADHGEAGLPDQVFGTDAHELHLLPARQRVLERCAFGHRALLGAEAASAARHLRQLPHPSNPPPRTIASAEPRLV